MKPRVVILWIVTLTLALTLPGCSGPSDPARTSPTANDATSITSAVASTSTSTAASSSSTSALVFPTTLFSPARDILGRMTLREKAAQVLLVALDGTTVLPPTADLLSESPPGGFLLLSRNIAGGGQLRSLTASLQKAAQAGGVGGVGVFVAVDQEGGSVQRVHTGVPHLPAPRALGDDATPAEAGRLAAQTAVGLLDLGVNMNLAPVADVVSDPKSFLYRRTYGGDSTLVADFVEEVTRAYVKNGLIVVVKHFPGHGSATGNTHGRIVVTEAGQAEIATIHLPPFKSAIREGAEGVMMAHIVVNAYDPDLPASLSPRVVGDLLREGLGFDGLIVTDDLEMLAAAPKDAPGPKVPSDPGDLAILALHAGCDLLISSGPLERQLAILDAIVEAVQTGRLAEARLNEAVLRMLTVKLAHGLVSS